MRREAEQIMFLVATHYGITVDNIRERTRRQPIATARFVAAYLMRHNTDMSLKEIASVLQKNRKMNHTSIMYAIRCVHDRLEVDEQFERSVEDIQDELNYTVRLPKVRRKTIITAKVVPMERPAYTPENEKTINKYAL